MTAWQEFSLGSICSYEYEYDAEGYTGWVRCKNGRMANGRWPEWNYRTGEKR